MTGIKKCDVFPATGLTAQSPRRAVCYQDFVGRFEAFFHKILHMQIDGIEMLQVALFCVCYLPGFQGQFRNQAVTGESLNFTEQSSRRRR